MDTIFENIYDYVHLRKQTTNYSFESCITKMKSIFAESLNNRNGGYSRETILDEFAGDCGIFDFVYVFA